MRPYQLKMNFFFCSFVWDTFFSFPHNQLFPSLFSIFWRHSSGVEESADTGSANVGSNDGALSFYSFFKKRKTRRGEKKERKKRVLERNRTVPHAVPLIWSNFQNLRIVALASVTDASLNNDIIPADNNNCKRKKRKKKRKREKKRNKLSSSYTTSSASMKKPTSMAWRKGEKGNITFSKYRNLACYSLERTKKK